MFGLPNQRLGIGLNLELEPDRKIRCLNRFCSLTPPAHYFQLHVTDWSENQKQKLAAAHEKGHELLAAVEAGTKWNLTQASPRRPPPPVAFDFFCSFLLLLN